MRVIVDHLHGPIKKISIYQIMQFRYLATPFSPLDNERNYIFYCFVIQSICWGMYKPSLSSPSSSLTFLWRWPDTISLSLSLSHPHIFIQLPILHTLMYGEEHNNKSQPYKAILFTKTTTTEKRHSRRKLMKPLLPLPNILQKSQFHKIKHILFTN